MHSHAERGNEGMLSVFFLSPVKEQAHGFIASLIGLFVGIDTAIGGKFMGD
ncbi:MAG: hypothetical protein ACI9MF_001026 [Gammaproteobacteria bacterium]|jgi:hypothetical protein